MAYKHLGRKIYWLKADGSIILEIGEREGWVLETTEEQDYEIYEELKGHSSEDTKCKKLEFGEFKDEFEKATSYTINPETEEIIFDYTPLPEPEPGPSIEDYYKDLCVDEIRAEVTKNNELNG